FCAPSALFSGFSRQLIEVPGSPSSHNYPPGIRFPFFAVETVMVFVPLAPLAEMAVYPLAKESYFC
ncbi:hypothetical protein, partial [Chlorobium sp. KB01]|uniref:hypothetical protein n=1 Tax=Chlorobium sp. KB01 TaxID=1917528 RepID=UPI001E3A8F52